MCNTRSWSKIFLFLPKLRSEILLLACVVFLGLQAHALAQASFLVTYTPTWASDNDNTARAGTIVFTQASGTSSGDPLIITYQVPITCDLSTISVIGTSGYSDAYVDTELSQNADGSGHGILVVHVPGGVGPDSPHPTITVSGVRLAVAGSGLPEIDAYISGGYNTITPPTARVIGSVDPGIDFPLTGTAGEINSTTGVVTISPVLGVREGYSDAFAAQGTGDTTSVMVRFSLSTAPPSGVTITFPDEVLVSGSKWKRADSDGNALDAPISLTNSDWAPVYYRSIDPTNPFTIETLLIPVTVTVSSSALPLPQVTVSYTASLAPIGPAFDLGGVILAPVPRFAEEIVGLATLFTVVVPPPCMPTSTLPGGFIAFDSLTYISGTNLAGDRLIVGSMTPANTDPFTMVPVPNASPNQQFCSPIEITPGLKVMAYVPTMAERAGDFSVFDAVGPSGLLADPLTLTDPWTPFPDGIIPMNRLWGITAWRIPAQPFVYFSTYTGYSILGIDGRFGQRQQGGNAPDGVAKVVRQDMSPSPESIVVGPDGKIYGADPDNHQIFRMNVDGTQLETVMNGAVQGPTGLSFNSLGDLYFNTKTPHTGVWKISAAQLSSLPADATNVIPGTCASPSALCTGSTLGGGTTFDWVGNLLVVDTSNNRVLIAIAPTYTSIAPLITTYLDVPIGIAVDRGSGDIFVANFGSSASSAGVNRFSSNGSFLSSVLDSGSKGFDGISRPNYIALDSTGVLYIATYQTSIEVPYSRGGKVWRLSFGTAGGLDLLTGLCDGSPHPPCSSLPPAVGVAVAPNSSNLPEGSYSPPPQELDPVVEPDRLTYDFGPYNYVVDYIGYPAFAGLQLRVTSMDTTQAEYQQRVAGTPFEGTTCSIFDGTGGYCEIFRLTCEQISDGSTVDCPDNPNPYTVTINWNTLETITNPGFLKAPLGTNDWENILTFFSQKRLDPPDPTGSGRASPRFSDFVFVYNVTGTPPTINLLSPPDGAVYALNQLVLADYSCTDPYSVVSACLGTVPKGAPVDTLSTGTKTFEVNATVLSGPSADLKAEYQVVGPDAYQTCLLYDPSKPAKMGSVVPIKLMICDGAVHDFSNPNMVLKAKRVLKGTDARIPVPYPGNTNPDNVFRFDPQLGTRGGYIYNLDTKKLPAGTWTLEFEIRGAGTPRTLSVQFKLK